MAEKQLFKLHANICKALGHAIRIEIIDVLQTSELTFTEILRSTGGLKSNLSQHLSDIVSKGILTQRKGSKCLLQVVLPQSGQRLPIDERSID